MSLPPFPPEITPLDEFLELYPRYAAVQFGSVASQQMQTRLNELINQMGEEEQKIARTWVKIIGSAPIATQATQFGEIMAQRIRA